MRSYIYYALYTLLHRPLRVRKLLFYQTVFKPCADFVIPLLIWIFWSKNNLEIFPNKSRFLSSQLAVSQIQSPIWCWCICSSDRPLTAISWFSYILGPSTFITICPQKYYLAPTPPGHRDLLFQANETWSWPWNWKCGALSISRSTPYFVFHKPQTFESSSVRVPYHSRSFQQNSVTVTYFCEKESHIQSLRIAPHPVFYEPQTFVNPSKHVSGHSRTPQQY